MSGANKNPYGGAAPKEEPEGTYIPSQDGGGGKDLLIGIWSYMEGADGVRASRFAESVGRDPTRHLGGDEPGRRWEKRGPTCSPSREEGKIWKIR